MVKARDFTVTLTCRHEECGEQFKKTSIDELHKLSKYFTNIIDGNITIDRKNSSFKVDILLRVPGSTIRAEHEDYNNMKALDAAIKKAKAQLKKLKGKVIDHRVTHQRYEILNQEPEENGNNE
ncbi:ribosome hibernation-promoting factor, HPF/YfiA family [Candidatus Latescibacterota bacterium]